MSCRLIKKDLALMLNAKAFSDIPGFRNNRKMKLFRSVFQNR